MTLIAKLREYGFNLNVLRLAPSYITKKKQRSEINTKYSSWKETLFGVPQRSILGRLLFNIFLCDLLFIMNETNFASYAGNITNTPHSSGQNIDDVIRTLENNSVRLFRSFSHNQMKANKDHCTKNEVYH